MVAALSCGGSDISEPTRDAAGDAAGHLYGTQRLITEENI